MFQGMLEKKAQNTTARASPLHGGGTWGPMLIADWARIWVLPVPDTSTLSPGPDRAMQRSHQVPSQEIGVAQSEF